jgi:hypothetical protein
MCITLWLLGNGAIKTLQRQRKLAAIEKVLDAYFYYAVRIILVAQSVGIVRLRTQAMEFSFLDSRVDSLRIQCAVFRSFTFNRVEDVIRTPGPLKNEIYTIST